MIDYRTQQGRLFPLLASAYAFRFVSEWLKWLYTDVTERLPANDYSTLPEAHACTAGLKSLTTSFTSVCFTENLFILMALLSFWYQLVHMIIYVSFCAPI